MLERAVGSEACGKKNKNGGALFMVFVFEKKLKGPPPLFTRNFHSRKKINSLQGANFL